MTHLGKFFGVILLLSSKEIFVTREKRLLA